MDVFFEKKDLAILQLVNLITESECQVLPLKTLSKKMQMDIKKVANILNDYELLNLAECGLSFWLQDDTLHFHQSEDYSFNTLYQLLFKKTLLFHLCDSIFHHSFTNLNDFSMDNFISLSSLYRRLHQLKLILHEYQITLDFTKPDLLIGEEKQIRHFYFELYFCAYGVAEDYLLEQRALDDAMEKHLSKSFPKIVYSVKQKIKLLTYISLIRIIQKQLIDTTFKRISAADVQLSSSDLSRYFASILAAFTHTQLPLTAEKDFFVSYITTLDVITIETFDQVNIQKAAHENYYLLLAKEWLTEFIHFFSIKLTFNEYFFLCVNLYCQYERNEMLTSSSVVNSQLSLLDHIFVIDDPYVYRKLVLFIQHLNESGHFPNKKRIYQFYYLLIRDVLFSFEIDITICVLSSFSRSQKMTIQKKISRLSPVPISFCDRIEDSPDLLVADFNCCSLKLKANITIPTVTTNSSPTEKSYKQIIDEILRICDSKWFKKRDMAH